MANRFLKSAFSKASPAALSLAVTLPLSGEMSLAASLRNVD